jgi:alkanesulfonate monooxygenase SsuD/methylene tetrahydromethanopterin reductase-like flavin-dependent oxidoreductase (luciferase family)
LNKIQFGVFLPFYAFKTKNTNSTDNFSLLKNIVLECEKLGYDSVWLDDHLMFDNWPIFECWTTLSALSTLTKTVRLGTMVTCNSFRHPAVIAKMAATLDVLSDGRLELGIGAGVQEREHESYGLDFSLPSVRIERLKEAVEIIKKLWIQEDTSYKGKYYSLKNAVCEPKPLQQPSPPITIGGSGEKLMLKVTAKYADRLDWGFLPTIDMYKRKLEILENYCKLISRDFNEIEKSCWPGGQVLIASNQKEIDAKIPKFKPSNVSVDDFIKANLIVTPDECMERLHVYEDLGVTYFMLLFSTLPNMDDLRLFAKTVRKKY